MILSGLDEAGLGPPLGPFCAALAEFQIQSPPADNPDLYEILSGIVPRNADGDGHWPVGDSKILYSPAKGLEVLESSLIAFLSVSGVRFPISFSGLISKLCTSEDAESLNSVPWFAEAESLMLPMRQTASKEEGAPGDTGAPRSAQAIKPAAPPAAASLQPAASSLAAALTEKGVLFRPPSARFITAAAFNRTITARGGKGGAVQSILSPLLNTALTSKEHAAAERAFSGKSDSTRSADGCVPDNPVQSSPPAGEKPRVPPEIPAASAALGDPAPNISAHSGGLPASGRSGPLSPAAPVRRITVDRQGGRRYYGEWLMNLLPGAPLRAVEEGKQRSVYTFGASSIEFTVGADGFRMETALASMLAKYIREAAMTLFNKWWSERAVGIKPTAGYPTDAKRFLKDLAAAGVLPADRDLLVRRL